jgi:hypothetical protein
MHGIECRAAASNAKQNIVEVQAQEISKIGMLPFKHSACLKSRPMRRSSPRGAETRLKRWLGGWFLPGFT